QWTADGVVISTAAYDQYSPTIVNDGSGGAIITWHDGRSVTSYDIYAQKINASGVVQWTADGVAISTAANNQYYPTIVSDGSGGAIITWQDCRSGANWDIYAQKINSSGAVQWITDGVAISTAANFQYSPTIVSDGSGGAIITWQDYRSGTSDDIYAQRINASGVVQWTANGVAISTAANYQYYPTIASDGSGGAIITWQDARSGNYDIFSQKINNAGVVQWVANGVAISTAANTQSSPTIVSDGSGGAIITWQDARSGTNDIYAQKINASGVVQWTADGVAISTASSDQSSPTIVSDGSGGAIITWQDYRSGTYYDIYAQKIDRYGFYGQAGPKLVAAKDIANDQGSRLRLFWDPSYLDAEAYQTIKSYTILLGAKTTGILGKNSESQGSGIYWQVAGSIPANWLEGYTTVIPTYADSGLQGKPMYYFQVIAKNSDSTKMWYSNIDSGYSVDNVPPVGVGNARIYSNGGGILLQWEKNRADKDLMEYRIYRSTTAGFAVGSGTQLSTTTDTTYNDPSGTNGTAYYYRIAAIDVHGNLGSPSSELNETALSLELTSFAVSANRRNANIAWSVATETNNFGYEIERRAAGGLHLEGGSHLAWVKAGFVEGSGTSQTARKYSYSDKNVGSGIFSYRLKQIDRNGQYTFSRSVEVVMGVAPNVFELAQNYPNPFNPTTNIEFTIPANGLATLKVFNSIGQEVATLFDGIAEAGKYHQVTFNAKDLSSGIYFARLISDGKSQIKKLSLLR
ncbi:MAG: T9SS type A sorting domain-containing protein, partial [Bacteroidota bacterium]|nr:T9SS type A sorting domain-containing protein [Bacteroidota bacterium]